MKKTQRMASVFEVMERPSEKLADECTPTSNPIAIDGLIEIKDVRFHYPSRPDTEVLQSFSLTLRPGTVTALCGPSGGGKTSVARLLLRDYEPCSGAVLIDGVDVRSLDLGGYRARVAVVSQEPSLFSGTIEDNIKFGASRGGEDVPHARVEAAARLANAHDFISALDAGYATAVGERGARLSGGQRQRIAIARALLMDPRILILDEATSALDAESEREVQEALDRAVRGRTTLVIAHRLSTVRAAHRIAVVERGRVSEEGTHEELAAAAGAYARLANAPPRVA